MVYIVSDELYHHGILGQKWGKKNGPPYPLSLSAHSASEKKAEWKKSLGKKESVDSASSESYNNQEKKIRNGKEIAKKILISAGTAAASIALGSIISSSGSGYGAESFNPEVYKKALMLQYSGNRNKKLYVDGQVILPLNEYKRVSHAINSNLTKEMRKASTFTFHLDDRVYVCENRKNDVPKIIDWFTQNEWDEALWEVLDGG